MDQMILCAMAMVARRAYWRRGSDGLCKINKHWDR